jgi:hypothetical protein
MRPLPLLLLLLLLAAVVVVVTVVVHLLLPLPLPLLLLPLPWLLLRPGGSGCVWVGSQAVQRGGPGRTLRRRLAACAAAALPRCAALKAAAQGAYRWGSQTALHGL